YGLCVMGAVLAGLVMMTVFCHREGEKRVMRVFAPLAIVLGFLGARLYHILSNGVLSGVFVFRLFSPYPFQYAMCGAILGVMGACLLSAKLTGKPFGVLADAMTPAGLLAIALERCGEVFSDFGWGVAMENGPKFFPLAVEDMYGQWHATVFFLEAVFALAALGYVLNERTSKPGESFVLGLSFWSAAQILCESFRAETLRWGFVRVQQVQCALFMLVVLAVHTRILSRKPYQKNGPVRLLSWITFLECTAAVVLMEYAIDKWTLPVFLDYIIMAMALCGMFASVRLIVRRALRNEDVPWKER
ncbi:MAG: prolipoprotein diacylglyceryl transferase, partial [Rhodocyclaceae bacterium]|nr:prolipoprotein diacylglyceryl transferase [Rhodocyclaceae bacterium]